MVNTICDYTTSQKPDDDESYATGSLIAYQLDNYSIVSNEE